MARMEIGKGIDLTIKSYQKASKNIAATIKQAVYPAAGYLADKIAAGLNELPTVEGKDGKPPYMAPGYKLDSISPVQKQDLIKGFGITAFENKNGYINVKLGFDGYGSYPTKKHPRGIPNALLIRSLEKGTDFLKKNNFITKIYNREKKTVEKQLGKNFNELISKEL